MMKHGTVVNAAPELIGKTALTRDHESDCDLIMLQFDDVNLEYEGKFLASGWYTFHRDSFETDEERVERMRCGDYRPDDITRFIGDENNKVLEEPVETSHRLESVNTQGTDWVEITTTGSSVRRFIPGKIR